MITPQINIYIKACNRPAYLDRCITSIRRNTSGYGTIIVLNDGIAGEHIARLMEKHEGLVVLDSPRLTFCPPEERCPPSRRLLKGDPFDPARFWVETVRRDLNKHVLILEEDTWLTEPVDLPLILRNLVANKAVFLRMYWHGNPLMSCQDEVYMRFVLDDHRAIEFYSPHVRSKVELFKIFYIAHGIYRTDYWLNSYEGIPYWSDEDYALDRAREFVLKHQTHETPLRFARLNREVIRHSVSSTSRADSGGVGIGRVIDSQLYTDILNDYWLKGELDPMLGYPRDFPETDLLTIFQKELDRREVAEWMAWKRAYVDMYRGMGASLE
ncbi:MAG TPA: hypothetical protein VEB64_13010 [Azospirillaceae bacterium]|nr:hypothetical protein [Azospirillaceae bacterium]